MKAKWGLWLDCRLHFPLKFIPINLDETYLIYERDYMAEEGLSTNIKTQVTRDQNAWK